MGMCGFARVGEVCTGVHGCGMNFQNFFWRIESLNQRTLIHILYEFFQSFFVLMTILALVNYKQTNENLVFRSSAMLQASLKFRPSKKSHFLTCFDLKPKLLLLVLMLLASFGAFA